MKIAIMQPYLFPYLGYIQLMGAVDQFIIYDDVQYIMRGWINRNNILVGGKALLFTMPLESASLNRTIVDSPVSAELFPVWQAKFRRTLQQAYSKAPYLNQVLELVDRTFEGAAGNSVAKVATESLRQVHQYLDLKSKIVPSSSIYNNVHLHGPERILDICRQENATQYVNPINGQSLYDTSTFEQEGIQLNFLRMQPKPYPQGKGEFVPYLSILDVLMFNDPAAVQQMLGDYELV